MTTLVKLVFAGLWLATLAAVVVASGMGYRDELFGWVHHVPGGDKTGHVLFMGTISLVLVLSCGRMVGRWKGLGLGRGCALLIGVLGILSAMEEGSQAFIPMRGFSYADMACSLVGIVGFGALGWWWLRRRGV